MPASALTMSDRVQVLVGTDRGESDGEIAQRLGRHRSTINAEINRNGGRGRYCPEQAQARADQCRRRAKVPKLVADPALGAEVQRRLEAKDSPMRISIELTRQGQPISHETIYQAIYRRDRGLPEDVYQHLHLRRRRRRRRGYRAPGSHALGVFCSIHDRPQIAADRSEIGHLEGDLITGAFNRSALITVFDRASRYGWFAGLNPTQSRSDATFDALAELLCTIPAALRHTLTWDQGSELARHHELATLVGIDIYIADPHAPWQRPTNENGNALLRRYVGKGTDLTLITPEQLHAIQHRINTIPRRVLNWHTAHDIYTHAVAMTG